MQIHHLGKHASASVLGVLACVAVVSSTLFGALDAHAASHTTPVTFSPAPDASTPDASTPDEVRWSAVPADADGPDGRRAVEHILDPGESVQEHLAVTNLGDTAVVFRVAAADGFYTRTGRFDVLQAGEASSKAGTWISVADAAEVPPGETVVIPYSLTVPNNAEPGDHAAGVTVSLVSVESVDGATVAVESRVGFRVTTRVTGELMQRASIARVEGAYDQSWNPFRAGSAVLTFDVVNEGNTRLLIGGEVTAGVAARGFPLEGDPQEILPGDSRTVTVEIDEVWPTFLVPTTVRLAPVGVTMDGIETPVAPSVIETAIWAVPVPQLAFVVGLSLVLLAVLWNRRRNKRALADLLAQAREEGRRTAQVLR